VLSFISEIILSYVQLDTYYQQYKLNSNITNYETILTKICEFINMVNSGDKIKINFPKLKTDENKVPTTELQKLRYIHQYPLIEIKILMFLNKLDEMAKKYNSRVIKLIGNHEIMNFIPYPDNIFNKYKFSNYFKGWEENNISKKKKITTYNQNNDTYAIIDDNINYKRDEYFYFGNPGFDLYRKQSTTILLHIKVNEYDYIFVHGGLIFSHKQHINEKDFDTMSSFEYTGLSNKNSMVIKLNNYLMYEDIDFFKNYKKKYINNINIILDSKFKYFNFLVDLYKDDGHSSYGVYYKTSELWTRELGSKFSRIVDDNSDTITKNPNFCDRLKQHLINLCHNDDKRNKKCNENKN
jgi:hypothetical protein